MKFDQNGEVTQRAMWIVAAPQPVEIPFARKGLVIMPISRFKENFGGAPV
jgi:hypothetical protein